MKHELVNPNKQKSMFDLFFGDRFYDELLTPATNWTPAVDIVDKGEKYLIKADLPGIDEKDISLEVNDGVLTLRGERKNEHEESNDNVYRCERTYGSFVRSFNLSEIKEEEIKAEYKNGLLTVELPKAEEKKAKKIEIKH